MTSASSTNSPKFLVKRNVLAIVCVYAVDGLDWLFEELNAAIWLEELANKEIKFEESKRKEEVLKTEERPFFNYLASWDGL